MKKITALLLAVLMLIGLLGCSNGTASSQETASAAESKTEEAAPAAENDGAAGETASSDYHEATAKIMIIGKNSTDPFTNWLLTAAQKTIDAEYPNVSYITTSLENDPSQIVTLLDQAALDGYDGVLIQKGSNSINSDAWYQSATEQGLKITAINAYANDGVSSASYADDTGMARTIAEYMVEKLPENAQVVFFKGPDGNQAAMDRVVAYRTYLFEARPDVKILAEDFVEGWTKENALALMEDWIQNFDTIDGVISVNDTMALAGLDALKNAGYDISNVYSCGIDGLADGCLSIQNGELTASVLQNADVMSEEGVRLLMEMINGNIDHDEYIVDGVLITADNVEEMIDMHRANGIIK